MRIAVVYVSLLGLGFAASCSHDPSGAAADRARPSDVDTVREWAIRKATAGRASPATEHTPGIAPVEDLIGRLEQRLAATPDDVDGWSLLAASHAYIGTLDKAAVARNRAIELGADPAALDARVVAAYAARQN